MSRTKLIPEQSIERARAALDRAKEKAARAQAKERERQEAMYWAAYHAKRNSIFDFEAITERVDGEFAQRFFPGATAFEWGR